MALTQKLFMLLKLPIKPLKNPIRKSIILLIWTISLTILASIAFLFIDWGLKKIIDTSDLSIYQYHSLTTNLFAGIATTLALLVALFRNELRSTWKYARLTFEQQESDGIFEYWVESPEKEPTAYKYTYPFIIENTGTIIANQCCIKIESITVKPKDVQKTKSIELDEYIDFHYLQWNLATTPFIDIPTTDKTKINLISLEFVQGATYGGEKSTSPTLNVGQVHINNEYESGTWTIDFALYCGNCKPIKKKIQVDWNGKWSNRKTEMMDNISFKEIS